VKYAGDTTRGPSALVWQGYQLGALRDSIGGYLFEEEFNGYVDGDIWTLTQATAGTFDNDPTAQYGVGLLDCGSTTATQGVQIQAVGAGFKPTAGETILFECRVKAADIATGPEFLAGLFAVDTTLIATSALSANGYGFQSVTDDGVVLSVAKDAGSAETGTGTTLVDDTWVKLGFRIDGLTKASYYVDGAKVNEETDGISANLVVPSFVCQSGGTTDPIVHIDWVKAAQITDA
jgi:hypothetical protein